MAPRTLSAQPVSPPCLSSVPPPSTAITGRPTLEPSFVATCRLCYHPSPLALRYLRNLKSYVNNKAKPEGSIAEGYVAEECLTFCSRYLSGVETHFNREERNFDEPV
ncbi:hypothetical protein QQ045_006294 [Rhodiola kirilowii]